MAMSVSEIESTMERFKNRSEANKWLLDNKYNVIGKNNLEVMQILT